MRLSELIFRAKLYERLLDRNTSRAMKTATRLGISPSFEDDPDMEWIEHDANRELCTPMMEEP